MSVLEIQSKLYQHIGIEFQTIAADFESNKYMKTSPVTPKCIKLHFWILLSPKINFRDAQVRILFDFKGIKSRFLKGNIATVAVSH